MIIGSSIKDTLNAFPEGKVFSITDFDVEQDKQSALVKALSRLVANGTIKKVSKGKYYKPQQTIFGELKPVGIELVKDLLERNGQLAGYITGTAAFAQMGLTTQISSLITIGTNKYRRPTRRGDYRVTFLLQPNTITEANIPLLRTLDALKLIKEIPATTPDESIKVLCERIRTMSADEQENLAELAKGYAPSVRALLGATLESIGAETFGLRSTLNGVTTYKIPISSEALPTKSNWNIV